jgi:thiol-disulfide isomerase/thioredoxin
MTAGAALAGDEHLDALVVQSFPEPLPTPGVTLKDLDGQPITLRDLRGKVVFLNFWATWCVPCRQEMPAIERLYQAYRDRGLAVLAVNFKEGPAAVRSFMRDLDLSYPAALDGDGAGSRSFGVRGLPVTYLLDREGRILWKAIGSREWDGPHARAYLERVLAAGARKNN